MDVRIICLSFHTGMGFKTMPIPLLLIFRRKQWIDVASIRAFQSFLRIYCSSSGQNIGNQIPLIHRVFNALDFGSPHGPCRLK